MTERDMQTFFGTYIKENPPRESSVYELKFTSGRSIRFDAVKEHQIEGLQGAEMDFCYHKLTDQPWMPDRPHVFQLRKPFDCFCFVGAKAYVVVWFYVPRKPKVFYFIPVFGFLQMMENSDRKSFTREMAAEAGLAIIVQGHKVRSK